MLTAKEAREAAMKKKAEYRRLFNQNIDEVVKSICIEVDKSSADGWLDCQIELEDIPFGYQNGAKAIRKALKKRGYKAKYNKKGKYLKVSW